VFAPHPCKDRDNSRICTGFYGINPQADAALYQPLNRLIVKTTQILCISGRTEVGMPVERICTADEFAETQLADSDLLHPVFPVWFMPSGVFDRIAAKVDDMLEDEQL
jgi:hypothetical protein